MKEGALRTARQAAGARMRQIAQHEESINKEREASAANPSDFARSSAKSSGNPPTR